MKTELSRTLGIEHAIFGFTPFPAVAEARGYDYLIGSADWMPRNLDRRVEALTPVEDAGLQERLDEILRVGFDADELAWELDPEGVRGKVPSTKGIDAHRVLQELAVARSGGDR